MLLEEEICMDGRTYWQGYTERYVKVYVENPGECRKLSRNTLVNVKIIGFLPENLPQNGLFGKVS